MCDCDAVPQLADVCDLDCQLQSLRIELPATGGTAVTTGGSSGSSRRLRESLRQGARRLQTTSCADGNQTACATFSSTASPLLVAVPQPDGSTSYVRLDGILNPLISSFNCQPLLRDGIDPSSADASDALAAQDGSNTGISAQSGDGSVTTFSARTCDMQSMVLQDSAAGGGFVGVYGLPPSLRTAIANAIATSSRRLEAQDVPAAEYVERFGSESRLERAEAMARVASKRSLSNRLYGGVSIAGSEALGLHGIHGMGTEMLSGTSASEEDWASGEWLDGADSSIVGVPAT